MLRNRWKKTENRFGPLKHLKNTEFRVGTIHKQLL